MAVKRHSTARLTGGLRRVRPGLKQQARVPPEIAAPESDVAIFSGGRNATALPHHTASPTQVFMPGRRVAMPNGIAQSPGTAPEQNGFAALLFVLAGGHADAIEAIRAGFPASLLKDTALYFDLPASRIRAIVRLPETTAHSLVKRGAKMDAAASERIWRLADVVAMAHDVFEDEQAAKVWLRTPNRTFCNLAPMDYLDTEPGAMSVRQVLNAIATGGAA